MEKEKDITKDGDVEKNVVADGVAAIVDTKSKTDEQNLNEENRNQEIVESLLADNNIDSVEELQTLMSSLLEMKQKLGGDSLQELKETKKLMEKYQEHWAKEAADEAESEESDNETIARLKKENAQLIKKEDVNKKEKVQAAKAQKVLKDFGNVVKKEISKDASIPKEFHNFLTEFMGVENPINNIDMTNLAKIKKTTKSGIEKFKKFEKAIIKNYLNNKEKLPPGMSSSSESAGEKPKKVKNIKDARGLAIERISAAIKAGSR